MSAIACALVVGAGAAWYAADQASDASDYAADTSAASQAAATAAQQSGLQQSRADIMNAVNYGTHRMDVGAMTADEMLRSGYGSALEMLRSGYGSAEGALRSGYGGALGQFQPLTGLEEYNAARQLLVDPSSIMQRPGVQFQREQGEEALQGAFSRSAGGGVSGSGMKAAIEYGQNFASTALDAELARLAPFINTAIGARTNIANLQRGRGADLANLRHRRGVDLSNTYQSFGTNLANLYQGHGQNVANLELAGATGTAAATGQMMPSIAQGISNQGNIAATNAINQANIQTGFYSNLAGMGSNMAMMYSMNPGMWGGGSNMSLQQRYPNMAINMV